MRHQRQPALALELPPPERTLEEVLTLALAAAKRYRGGVGQWQRLRSELRMLIRQAAELEATAEQLAGLAEAVAPVGSLWQTNPTARAVRYQLRGWQHDHVPPAVELYLADPERKGPLRHVVTFKRLLSHGCPWVRCA